MKTKEAMITKCVGDSASSFHQRAAKLLSEKTGMQFSSHETHCQNNREDNVIFQGTTRGDVWRPEAAIINGTYKVRLNLEWTIQKICLYVGKILIDVRQGRGFNYQSKQAEKLCRLCSGKVPDRNTRDYDKMMDLYLDMANIN